MEVTDDEEAINLLIGLKCTFTETEPISPIRNMPQSTSLVFCETNVRDSKYNTEEATYHFL